MNVSSTVEPPFCLTRTARDLQPRSHMMHIDGPTAQSVGAARTPSHRTVPATHRRAHPWCATYPRARRRLGHRTIHPRHQRPDLAADERSLARHWPVSAHCPHCMISRHRPRQQTRECTTPMASTLGAARQRRLKTHWSADSVAVRGVRCKAEHGGIEYEELPVKLPSASHGYRYTAVFRLDVFVVPHRRWMFGAL